MQHRPTLKATFQQFEAGTGPVDLFIRGYSARIIFTAGSVGAIDGQAFGRKNNALPTELEFPPVFDAYGLPWYYDQRITIVKTQANDPCSGLLVLFDLDQQQHPVAGPIGRRPIDNSPAQG